MSLGLFLKSAADIESWLDDILFINNQCRENQTYEYEICWNDNGSKDAEGLDWHNWTENICKESYASGARCYEHGSG